MKVGCQLIVFGQKAKQSPAAVIASLADAGYAGIECAEPAAWIAPEDLKGLLDERDMELVGIHVGYPRLFEPEELIDQAKKAGGQYIMVSGVAQREGIAAYDEAADTFNRAGHVIAEADLVLAYHNHSWEFAEFDGVAGIDRLYQRTDPAVVKLCIDTYWVHDGGRDVVDFIRANVERTPVLHLKDRLDDTYAEVGEGILDFPAIVDVAREGTVDWLVVEQDTTTRTPEESAAISRRYLMETIGI